MFWKNLKQLFFMWSYWKYAPALYRETHFCSFELWLLYSTFRKTQNGTHTKISKLNWGLKLNRGGGEKFSKFPQCWGRSHHSMLLGMKILKKCNLIPYTTFRHKRIVLTSLSYFARYTLHKKCRNPLWKTLFFFLQWQHEWSLRLRKSSISI